MSICLRASAGCGDAGAGGGGASVAPLLMREALGVGERVDGDGRAAPSAVGGVAAGLMDGCTVPRNPARKSIEPPAPRTRAVSMARPRTIEALASSLFSVRTCSLSALSSSRSDATSARSAAVSSSRRADVAACSVKLKTRPPLVPFHCSI